MLYITFTVTIYRHWYVIKGMENYHMLSICLEFVRPHVGKKNIESAPQGQVTFKTANSKKKRTNDTGTLKNSKLDFKTILNDFKKSEVLD